MRYFILFLLVSAVCLADGPMFKHDHPMQREFEEIYQELEKSIYDELTVISTLTVQNKLFVGIGPIPSFSCEKTSGGSLTIGTTYYSKVWPVSSLDYIGGASAELAVFPETGLQTITCSWGVVNGAAYYRLEQGTVQGGPSGYFQTTDLSFASSGQAYTGSGQGYSGLNFYTTTSNGGIILPGGFGINWTDYATGAVYAGIAATSAGELSITAPSSGSAAGVFSFTNSNNSSELLKLYPAVSAIGGPGVYIYSPGNSGTNGPMYLAGSTISIRPGQVSTFDFLESGMNILIGKSLSFTNASGNASSTIFNPGATNERALRFTTTSGNINFNDNGTITIPSMTLANINATSFTDGTYTHCSDCTADSLCISTGGAAGLTRASSKTTRCQ